MMFGRFTERAQKVLALAQQEAIRLGHNNIGTEHILLGLIREGEGIAAKALQELGLEVLYDEILTFNDRLIRHKTDKVAQILYSLICKG